MLFNSSLFLFFFLPVAYAGFWWLRAKTSRYVWLTLTGYVFYGYWNPRFCLLMLLSTLVSFTAGLGMLRWPDSPSRRRWLMAASVTIDLLLLGFFKYADFGIRTLNVLFSAAGTSPLRELHILLPVGISFYTFHTITYIVDAYRGKIKPTRNFFEFSCYVSLFSQLVAGPIVRYDELQNDLATIESKDRHADQERGWSYFVIGLAQKLLIADVLAQLVDPALAKAASLSFWGSWLAMAGYSYQLYFDFAGYSNMAIGLGYLFGMHIPLNFNSPYKALNPSDFWSRWHISLSRCLKDYLYIPLGGNRLGESTTYRNLMITMLLGGLWHGAASTFVAWGAYHGCLLAAYRRWGGLWDRLPPWLQRAGTFLLVVLGWVFFRAPDWPTAATLFSKMLVPSAFSPIACWKTLVAFLLLAGSIAHFAPNASQLSHRWKPLPSYGLAALLILCLWAIQGGQASPFLYFQF